MTPLNRSIQLEPGLPTDLLTSTFDTHTISVICSYSNTPRVQTTTKALDLFNTTQLFSLTNAESQFIIPHIIHLSHSAHTDREFISMSSSFCLPSFFILIFFTQYLKFVITKYSYNSLLTQTHTPDTVDSAKKIPPDN